MAAITTHGENAQGGLTYSHCLGYTVQIDYDPDKLNSFSGFKEVKDEDVPW